MPDGTKISPVFAKAAYLNDSTELKRNMTRVKADIDRLDRDFKAGKMIREDYVLARGRLVARGEGLIKVFKEKWENVPKEYFSDVYTQKDTRAAKEVTDKQKLIILNGIEKGVTNRQRANQVYRKFHGASIAYSEGCTAAMDRRKMICPRILNAINSFEKFLVSAVKLGYISRVDAEARLEKALEDGSTLTNESSLDRQAVFVDNLNNQVRDIQTHGINGI